MIIFGTRGVTGTKDRGTFHCPQCSGACDYAMKRVRRFFTLYFIPVIPLDMLGEYVECSRCQGTYDVRVLEHDPGAQQQHVQALFMVAMKQVMIAILVADGVVDDDEVRVLREVFEELSGASITEADLRAEIAEVQTVGSSPIELVSGLAPGLNDRGKEMVVRAAYKIAAADGEVAVDELRTMAEIGQALEMTTAHYKGVLAELGAA